MQKLIADLKAALQEHTTLYATPDDANYFRKKKPAPVAPPPPAPVIIQAPPKPIQPPAPAPVIAAPKPEAKPEVKPEVKPEPVKLEPLAPIAPPSFQDLRRLLSVTAPNLPILDQIPSDEMAQKIANQWKTKNQTAPITILSFQESPEQRALLEQIAKAVDVCFGPARFINAEPIEKEKQWEAFLTAPELKTVIICDYSLWQLHNLMQFYKENPNQKTRTLGSATLFLLPDLSLYLKNPALKRSLWKALNQAFSK
jgi:hypothetical protein